MDISTTYWLLLIIFQGCLTLPDPLLLIDFSKYLPFRSMKSKCRLAATFLEFTSKETVVAVGV
jgi:hypothetical protein